MWGRLSTGISERTEVYCISFLFHPPLFYMASNNLQLQGVPTILVCHQDIRAEWAEHTITLANAKIAQLAEH